MKTAQKEGHSLCIYSLTVLGTIIYLYGFFPIDRSLKLLNISQKTNVSNSCQNIPRIIDKLALIIIDSLRYDFVFPESGRRDMLFTANSILNNQSCLYTIKVDSPTVTMPRIKALTSGISSTYIDLILNFKNSSFQEDNFLKKAVEHDMNIVFYGDDTWLKLFPNTFLRSGGTNSFFVFDFNEVDYNVTRNIDSEFQKADWDILILHYLGLDHIGHLEGPNSALIGPKLQEMDSVIKKVSNHFKFLEKQYGFKTAVIITGDHGMKDSGGHGGNTFNEITVPLVLVGKQCMKLPGWPEENHAFQIDVAPTISALLGLPSPLNNMGKIIPTLLHGLKIEEIIMLLEQNRQQLAKFKNLVNTDITFEEIAKKYTEWISNNTTNITLTKTLIEKYYHHLHKLTQAISKGNSDFKFTFLIIGITILWMSLIALFVIFYKQFSLPMRTSQWFLVITIVLHAFSLASSSFIEEEHQTWYFTWMTFCILAVFESLKKRGTLLCKVKTALPWIIFCIINRILRKLNQTGDKWAFLPDIKFYLYSPEGQFWLLFTYLSGIGILFWFAYIAGCRRFQLFTFGLSLFCAIIYNMSVKNIHIKSPKNLLLSGMNEINMFWIFSCIFSIQTFLNKTPVYLIWILQNSLFLRPHNVILMGIEIFTSRQIYEFYNEAEDQLWNNIAHICLGNVFYFYQGNGNSLANIDVRPGFIGVKSFVPLYAGITISAHTFNAQILSFMLSPKSNIIISLLRSIPLTLYCSILIFQLHHLFIWSVFSPKLLYEAGSTLIFLILMLSSSLSQTLIKKKLLKHY